MGKGMKKLMPKKTICKLGLLTLGIYVILAVTPICFSGVTYNLINYNWATDGLWRHLGNLEIISCVLFFLSAILGVLFFTIFFKFIVFRAIYLVIEFFSIIFIFSVSIITLVGSRVNFKLANSLAQCHKNFEGIYTKFNTLEGIISAADKLLCSDKCMCYFDNKTAYDDFIDPYKHEVYNDSIKNYSFVSGAKKVSDCPYFENSLYEAASNLQIRLEFGAIDLKKFVKFWGRIESKFDCNGWCEIYYDVQVNGKDERRQMVKPVFSDINHGYVINRGCYQRIAKWLPRCLKALGSMFLITSVGMMVNIVFTFMVTFGLFREDDYEARTDKTEKRRGEYIEISKGGNKFERHKYGRKNTEDKAGKRRKTFDDYDIEDSFNPRGKQRRRNTRDDIPEQDYDDNYDFSQSRKRSKSPDYVPPKFNDRNDEDVIRNIDVLSNISQEKPKRVVKKNGVEMATMNENRPPRVVKRNGIPIGQKSNDNNNDDDDDEEEDEKVPEVKPKRIVKRNGEIMKPFIDTNNYNEDRPKRVVKKNGEVMKPLDEDDNYIEERPKVTKKKTQEMDQEEEPKLRGKKLKNSSRKDEEELNQFDQDASNKKSYSKKPIKKGKAKKKKSVYDDEED